MPDRPHPHGLTRAGTVFLTAVVAIGACAGGSRTPDGPGEAAPRASATSVAIIPSAVTARPAVTPAPRGDLIAARVGGADVATRRLRFVDSASGTVEADLPDGVIDRVANIVYVAAPEAGGTRISAMDLTTGLTLRSRLVAGILSLPAIGVDATPVGLSGDGGTLVLAAVSGPEAKGPAPAGYGSPAVSRFTVLDTRLAADPRVVELPGRFSFDALSPDGSVLYVVEHLPAVEPTDYQVRAYDLALGAMREGVIVDKAAGSLLMSGEPVAQVPSRGGGWVYTLYRNVTRGPFIHALNAQDGFALCIFPKRSDDALAEASAARSWELGLSPDGTWLYAANGRLGTVVQVPTADLTSPRTVALPRAAEAAAPGDITPSRGMAVTGDGVYVAGAGAVLRLTVPTLAVADRWPVAGSVTALAARPAGGLYAVAGDGVLMALGADGVAGRAPLGGGTARILWVQARN